MDGQKLSVFLLKLRKENNLSQKDISKLCNVTVQAVSKWERGESVPDIALLEKLSSFYKLSINELINGETKELDSTTKRNLLSKLNEYKHYKREERISNGLILKETDNIKSILFSKLLIYFSIILYITLSIISLLNSILSELDGINQKYTMLAFVNIMLIFISIILIRLLKYIGSIYSDIVLMFASFLTLFIPIIFLIIGGYSTFTLIFLFALLIIPVYLLNTAILINKKIS